MTCGDENFGAPADQTVSSGEELEVKLEEGLASGPATVMTAAEWQKVRREVAQRLRKPSAE